VRFEHVVFEICQWTDGQTDSRTETLIAIFRTSTCMVTINIARKSASIGVCPEMQL